MKATFFFGVDRAVLQSPRLSMTKSRCLSFQYQISTPKIRLEVITFVASGQENAKVVRTLKYMDQTSAGSWNSATTSVGDDIGYFQFVASKRAATTDMHFVLLDNIRIFSCTKGKM